MKWEWRNDRHSECNLCNCLKKSEKNLGLQQGLNPWPRGYWCDALPTKQWSHWRWEQVNCWFICSRGKGGVKMTYEITYEMRKWNENVEMIVAVTAIYAIA